MDIFLDEEIAVCTYIHIEGAFDSVPFESIKM